MKRFLSTALSVAIMSTAFAVAQNRIVIPDTDKHLILTGDMHLHTIFSDGKVWPTTRVDEALSEGVEVICITDHLDSRNQKLVNKGVFNCDKNYSYDVAAEYAESKDIIVIKGDFRTLDDDNVL